MCACVRATIIMSFNNCNNTFVLTFSHCFFKCFAYLLIFFFIVIINKCYCVILINAKLKYSCTTRWIYKMIQNWRAQKIYFKESQILNLTIVIFINFEISWAKLRFIKFTSLNPTLSFFFKFFNSNNNNSNNSNNKIHLF